MDLTPPSLEFIMGQWDKDSQIDNSEAGMELLRVPALHNKYSRFLSLHNLAAKKTATALASVRKIKWLYYNGKLSQKELAEKGWEQFPFTLKSDLNIYLEADDDLRPLIDRKSYHEECSSYCVYVMKELNNRTWQLKTYLDYLKYNQGD